MDRVSNLNSIRSCARRTLRFRVFWGRVKINFYEMCYNWRRSKDCATESSHRINIYTDIIDSSESNCYICILLPLKRDVELDNTNTRFPVVATVVCANDSAKHAVSLVCTTKLHIACTYKHFIVYYKRYLCYLLVAISLRYAAEWV